jgi:hypothetical protein
MRKKRSKYKQGKYKPINPDKYVGDINNIIYRSGWELKWCKLFDNSPSIIEWGSEPFSIQYVGIDNKNHRYFPDFAIKYKSTNNEVKRMLIEVKPFAQTQPPKRQSKFYGDHITTYLTNQHKWKEAKKYAKRHNSEFVVLTEHSLNKFTKR